MICVVKGEPVANSTHLKPPEFLHGLRMLIMRPKKKPVNTHKKKNQDTSLNSSVKGSIFLCMLFYSVFL